MSLFNFFKVKPKSYLGIDIGASAVKVVHLEKDEERYKLKNYAIYSLKGQLKRNNYQVGMESSKIPAQEMGEIIKKLFKEAEIDLADLKEIYLSVPVYYSFSTLIDLPNLSEKEIASAVPFEARKYIPLPISEIVLDWTLVSSPNKTASRQILIIAVPKKVIAYYNDVMKAANLTLKVIEEETFSLSRALVGNDKSGIIMLDVGARSISVSIVDDGYVRLTHNLELGGIKITRAIAEQMSFDMEKAEQVKKDLSESQTRDEYSAKARIISQTVLKLIVTEMKKIIDNYQNKYKRKMEKCVLVGSGVHLVGFIDYLTQNLSMDISVGNPFARVEYPVALKPILRELGPALSVAVGLAMR
ncbi:type IV pilus assembly protein PilM [Patescibacteria group bacterium]|nr:type IV pilus assembly protein PilM [Patescibacteria group bacterium]